MNDIKVRDATARDAQSVAAIYAPFVTDTAVSFETEPPKASDMAERIESAQRAHAWLVAERDEQLVGYCYGTTHRDRAAYRYSVEISVYVDGANHRQGIGMRLYQDLFKRLAGLGYYNAYVGITLPNEPSLAFHQTAGFRPVGVFKSIGFKFNSWHDVAWLQRKLKDGQPDDPGV